MIFRRRTAWISREMAAGFRESVDAMAPAAMNCAAPHTATWMCSGSSVPTSRRSNGSSRILSGDIRSALAMTEPAVASCDTTNIATSIVRDGDDHDLNGRTWCFTGAMNPNGQVSIVTGKTDPVADRYRQQSTILVERDRPGFEIHRGMTVLAYDDHRHGGHAELSFTDVRVPAVPTTLAFGTEEQKRRFPRPLSNRKGWVRKCFLFTQNPSVPAIP